MVSSARPVRVGVDANTTISKCSECRKAKFIVDSTQLRLREACIGVALLIRQTIEPYILTR